MTVASGPGGTTTLTPQISDFPPAPKGENLPISNAGQSLARAAEQLVTARAHLAGAAEATTADWHGWAASRYRESAESLAGIINTASESLEEMADACRGYARDLLSTQNAVLRLQQSYDTAVKAADDAAGRYNQASARASSHPHEAVALSSHMNRAFGDMNDAQTDANRYVKQAEHLLSGWRSKQQGYTTALEGYDNAYARGFGLPAQATQGQHASAQIYAHLKQYDGVFNAGASPGNSSPIPGFSFWWTSRHENLQSVDDLTNVFLILAGPLEAVGKAFTSEVLKPLGRDTLDKLAELLGIDSGAVDVTSSEGRDAIFGALKRAMTDPFEAYPIYTRLLDGTVSALGNTAKRAWASDTVRGQVIDKISDLLGLTRLDPEASQVVNHLVEVGTDPETWNARATQALFKLRDWSVKLKLPKSAVDTINHLLGVLAESSAKAEA